MPYLACKQNSYILPLRISSDWDNFTGIMYTLLTPRNVKCSLLNMVTSKSGLLVILLREGKALKHQNPTSLKYIKI